MPPLNVADGRTIASQAAQSYTQCVPMHEPDHALSILPIGPSTRPNHPTRNSTLTLWSTRQLHPAPLSRPKVDRIASSHLNLHNE